MQKMALDEKNARDMQVQRDQAERHVNAFKIPSNIYCTYSIQKIYSYISAIIINTVTEISFFMYPNFSRSLIKRIMYFYPLIQKEKQEQSGS
jgi:hypothetical protein